MREDLESPQGGGSASGEEEMVVETPPREEFNVAAALGRLNELPMIGEGLAHEIALEFLAPSLGAEAGAEDEEPKRRARQTTAELKAVIAKRASEEGVAANERLPRGPHDLTREEVELKQRRRILRALVEVADEVGYNHTAVSDIIRRAGVSRATFYALYGSKDACFREAWETTVQVLIRALLTEVIDPAQRVGLEGRERLVYVVGLAETFLKGLIARFEENPSLSKVFLVDSFSVGPEVLQRRAHARQAVTSLLTVVLYGENACTPEREADLDFVISGMFFSLTTHFATGRESDLRPLAARVARMLRLVGEAALDEQA